MKGVGFGFLNVRKRGTDLFAKEEAGGPIRVFEVVCDILGFREGSLRKAPEAVFEAYLQ